MSDELEDRLSRMITDPKAPTAPLDVFLPAYEADDNIWWMIASGHHMNLFDQALDRIRELELLILNTADQVQAKVKQTEELAEVAATELDKLEDAIKTAALNEAYARGRNAQSSYDRTYEMWQNAGMQGPRPEPPSSTPYTEEERT